MKELETIRRAYEDAGLDEQSAADDPFAQFDRWLADALATDILEPNAMTLSTVDAEGRPHARVVLLRGADARGLVFFTNLESAKAREIAASREVAATFLWAALARQVRVEGAAERVEDAVSDAYFASRPRGHQIGAWASPQSEVISGRDELEARAREAEARFSDGAVPRPEFWGGLRIVPRMIEFWQGRANRLHDRLRYRRDKGAWVRERLAP